MYVTGSKRNGLIKRYPFVKREALKGQRKKGKNLRYKVCSCLLTLFLGLNLMTTKITYVKADDVVNLAEYILTLYASMGVGISDASVLGAFQTHLGSGIAVGTDAIQTAIAACEQAMGNSMITSAFASTAESTAEYVASVGAENLAGATTATATAAQNIGASIANYQAYGFVAPVQGGNFSCCYCGNVCTGCCGRCGWWNCAE